jgi:hypothetical protein
MSTTEQYKKQFSIILDNLPIKKVIELFNFAQFLDSQYSIEKRSTIDENSLMLQQQSLKKNMG